MSPSMSPWRPGPDHKAARVVPGRGRRSDRRIGSFRRPGGPAPRAARVFARRKMAASTRSIHSRRRAAGGRSTSSTSKGSSPSRRRRRAAVVKGRTAEGGPAGEFAGGPERDEPVEQPPRGAVGYWRLARRLGGREAVLSQQQVDDFRRRFGAQLWGGGDEGLGAAGKMSGEVEGGGGGQRDRARGGVRPAGSLGLGRPPPSDRRLGSRIFVAISGRGCGQRSRMARTRSNSQSARISDGAAGASGKTEDTRAAVLPAAETGSPSPAEAFRLAARPFGSTARSSSAATVARRSAWNADGRPARSRHSRSRLAAGLASSPMAKRRSRSAPSSALTRRILAEAAAL